MKCKTRNCKNEAAKHRRVCNTCKSRDTRKKNIITYLYHNLKSNAKKRGKEFGLSFAEFKDFCIENNYHFRKGRNTNSLTVDRIDPTRGYFADNIRAVTLSENIKYQRDYEKIPDYLKINSKEDVPF